MCISDPAFTVRWLMSTAFDSQLGLNIFLISAFISSLIYLFLIIESSSIYVFIHLLKEPRLVFASLVCHLYDQVGLPGLLISSLQLPKDPHIPTLTIIRLTWVAAVCTKWTEFWPSLSHTLYFLPRIINALQLVKGEYY